MSVVANIVIVSHKTPELAVKCARSIITGCDVPAECRIVDTSDGEGALTIQPNGVWVHYEKNIGYARAINRGVAAMESRGPLLIVMNADTEFPSDGIGALLELFDEVRPLAIIGPRQVTPDGRIAHAGMSQLGDTTGGRGFGDKDEGQYTERMLEVAQVSGSVMLARREAWDRLGGMPEPAGALYFEDSELCARAHAEGWKVAYSGLRTFIHHVGASPAPAGMRLSAAQESARGFADRMARIMGAAA